jgi:rod shape-determining protein MreC
MSLRPPPASPVVISASSSVKRVVRQAVMVVILLGLVVAILLARHNMAYMLVVQTTLQDMLSPMLRVWSWPARQWRFSTEYAVSLWNIHQENQNLKQENSSLKIENNQLRQYEGENVSLRKLLRVTADAKAHYITARVISDVSGPFGRSVMLNTGSNQLVQKGHVLINEEGVVGRIIEVGQFTSRAILLTDLNSKIPIITGETRERAIAAGRNKDEMVLNYLPDNHKIKVGELVFTSGDGAYYPAGLLVGTVEDVTVGNVRVRPLVRWHQLEFVQIVRF